MPKTDAIPVSASIASVGKGIRYIGTRCYAYSGIITPTGGGSADTVALDFTIGGAGYILAEVQASSHSESSGAVRFTDIIFNGLVVARIHTDNGPDFANYFPAIIIIPPETHVVVKVGQEASIPFTITLTGRVYGAE